MEGGAVPVGVMVLEMCRHQIHQKNTVATVLMESQPLKVRRTDFHLTCDMHNYKYTLMQRVNLWTLKILSTTLKLCKKVCMTHAGT